MKTLTTLSEHLEHGLIWADTGLANRDIHPGTADPAQRQEDGQGAAGSIRRELEAAMPCADPQEARAAARSDAPPGGPMAGGGLEMLLTAIRADLLEPWNTLMAETRLASRTQHPAQALDDLLARMEEVGGTLHKLLDLAQIWSSPALVTRDRMDLWDMLHAVWQEVEPLALGRALTVRFARFPAEAEVAAVYGSEPWLRRVLIECLESEIRGSAHGACIEIEYHQLGARGLIVFRDACLFAPPRKPLTAMDLLMQPVRTQADSAERLSARDLIGLRLCKSIVDQHGGQLRQEHDGTQRSFLIDLPTGADGHPGTRSAAGPAVRQGSGRARSASQAAPAGRRRGLITSSDISRKHWSTP